MTHEKKTYRLTYLQTLLNPTGGILQVLLGVMSGVGAYFALRQTSALIAFKVVSAVLFLCCGLLLFWRSSKRRSLRYILLSDKGIDYDLGDCVMGGCSQRSVSPYQSVTVLSGVGGVSVLKADSGHFVLVPESAFPASELRRVIEDHRRTGK